MKNILKTLSFVLLVSISGNAQTGTPKKGDKQYGDLAYIDAIKTYERVANKGNKSVELFERLGNSYYFNAKLKQANKWYGELFAMNETVEPEYYYRYAQTLKAVGDDKKADEYLAKFKSMSANDLRATLYDTQKDYKEVIAKNSGRYDIKNVSVNSKLSDYGSALYGDKVIFSTSRDSIGIVRSNARWTSNSFTNLYEANRQVEEGELTNAKKFSTALNSKYHEDSPVFTKDLQTVYFTRNNYNKGKTGKDGDKTILLKIYKATLEGSKWKNVVELPFNSDQYSVAHPALSPDEKTLYFASNMPGTKGLSDIYKVAINGEDSYGTPENLTGSINTEARETFPFITPDNELYFASDGHPGLGGLDVFVTKLNAEGQPGEIVNVGEPINGSMDDFAFLIDKSTKTGYFSSNRDGGKGLDDIYSFKEKKPLPQPLKEDCKQELAGIITNETTGEVLTNAKVTLSDENFVVLQTQISDDKGNYTFNVECGKKYYVKGEKEGFETKETKTIIPNKSGKSTVKLATPQQKVVIEPGVTKLEKVLNIPIIYFDLDKSFIRADAAVELEKVLDVMNEYPNMKIDVRSHTDSRQTFKYNEALSSRRNKSTRAWLVKNGINANRLTGRGYGETQLTNECADGVNCTEEQHQLNRRSEFIVVSQ